jgi:NADH:ubiquinone oxidoreductase subunit 5 (subunit L)/multisubunit Na+/H+ antiporter MnhA subunit
MEREFPIWVIVLLPWVGALGCLLAARPGVRVLGSPRAALLGHYLGLGAAALALLFAVQGLEHLMVSDDPRALGHTPMPERFAAVVIGALRIESTLIADRLSTCAAFLLLAISVLARMFMAGPAGRRDLFGPVGGEPDATATRAALGRLALLGLLEGAAALVVFAGDLGLAAIGWALLGFGCAAAVTRELTNERRASAAGRVLIAAVLSDLALIAAGVGLLAVGIGLAHNNMWAPLTGDRLYELALRGVSFADVIALGLLVAVFVRMASMAWAGNSLLEVVLDAVLIPVPAIYLVLRYQRVLAYAPGVLAGLLVVGLLLALLGAGIGLARPQLPAPSPERPGRELGLAGTGLAQVGLVALALGVGAWRTAALLLLAHALGRFGLRLALLVASGERLQTWTARAVRVLCFGVAGIVPGLGFVALAQVLVDVLTRSSVLAPWISWLAALVVLLVAFVHAVAIARLWYEELGRRPGALESEEDDGIELAVLALLVVALVGLGVVGFGAWFGLSASPLAWLDKILPLAGGHERAPTGVQDGFRDVQSFAGAVARPWLAGSAALMALVTGFAWTWTRERLRRGHGAELVGLTAALERGLAMPLRAIQLAGLLFTGLSELAARGIGRALFEEGPHVLANLGRDLSSGFATRMRSLSLGGGRLALLGMLAGFGLLLGWLYGKPQVSSVWPSDEHGYGFGGLRPRLIRAGGGAGGASGEAVGTEPSPVGTSSGIRAPEYVPEQRRDGAEPPRLVPASRVSPSSTNPTSSTSGEAPR